MPAREPEERLRAWGVTAIYAAVAVVVTWPLARRLGTDVAWDLGDSLLNMWILSWDCEQLRAILGGDIGRIPHFFDGNIFYPQPLTLAYSEHLFAQAVQVLPIYIATRNPILCYNLLFLSTYILSGLGTYLLVGELTGSRRAAFVAGLVFAFAPYRIPQAAHVQVLSSQWMPITLYALTRYFKTGKRRALAAAAAALVAENLSCGYYLLYFAPLAGAYALWEIGCRRLWRDRRVWTDLAVAAAATAILTAPFVVPYMRVRERFQFSRGLEEITLFSADVYSYLTAFPTESVWGRLADVYPKVEGELFPGLVPVLLAAAAISVWTATAWRKGGSVPQSAIRNVAATALGGVAIVALALTVIAIFERRLVIDAGLVTIRITNLTRLLIGIAAAVSGALAISPRARARAGALLTYEGFFVVALVASWWLSLGPQPRVMGRPLELLAPYRFLYEHVPGVDGLRVPGRFAMLVMLMLAVLAGYGALVFARRRSGLIFVAAAAVAFLAESHSRPFLINATPQARGLATPEPRVYRPARAPAAYRTIARLPRGTVLIELPLGSTDYDLRAVYYSTAHWHSLVNGYSGFFPPQYSLLVAALTEPMRHGDLSWPALQATGATHVLVHEQAYLGDEGSQTSAWLRASGATEVFRDGGDVVFALPR